MSRQAYHWTGRIARAFSLWAPILCIPTVALLVAFRQVYLSNYRDLSTWKGGGMGMFAGADGSLNRYTKIFIADSHGKRQPLTQLPSEPTKLINRALNYPVRKNFLLAAKTIATLDWVAARQRMPVALIDANRQTTGTAPESYYMMVPFGRRPREETWKWDIQIEYWRLSYNPVTKHAHAVLAETFVFGPEELRP
ncbi:MAG: hypothetical protein QOI04_1159 [Verrucomicrobiota bacterium]|jgi:hypothetical protein